MTDFYTFKIHPNFGGSSFKSFFCLIMNNFNLIEIITGSGADSILIEQSIEKIRFMPFLSNILFHNNYSPWKDAKWWRISLRTISMYNYWFRQDHQTFAIAIDTFDQLNLMFFVSYFTCFLQTFATCPFFFHYHTNGFQSFSLAISR